MLTPHIGPGHGFARRALLVGLAFAAAGSVGASPAKVPAAWRERAEGIAALLAQERWTDAEAAARAWIGAVAQQDPDDGRLIALSTSYLAVAEARRGASADAVWHWQVALALDPALAAPPVDDPVATELFTGHGRRAPGEIPGGAPSSGDLRPAVPLRVPHRIMPPSLAASWTRTKTTVELVIDDRGALTAPLVIAGAAAAKVFYGLEMIHAWRFRPAALAGQAQASLLVLEDFAPHDSLAWRAAGNPKLAPLHALALEGRWQEADEAAAKELAAWVAADQHPPESASAASLERDYAVADLLALAAVAKAGLGREQEALWSWWMSASFRAPNQPVGFEPYETAGELLERHPMRCPVGAEVPCPVPHWEELQGVVAPQVTRRRFVELPAARPGAPPSDRIVIRLLVGADGKPREPQILAGGSRSLGYLALASLAGWELEPARRGGEPVETVTEVSAAFAADGPRDVIHGWNHQVFPELEAELRAGRGAAALAHARELTETVAGTLARGGSDLLARALTLQALAEAAAGAEAEASWHWQMAQNLAWELRGLDLSSFGEAGALIAGARLRLPGQPVPDLLPAAAGAVDPEGGPAIVERAEPRFPPSAPASDVAQIELLVSPEGLPGSPLVLAGSAPVPLFQALEAIRGWRFAPLGPGSPAGVRRATPTLLLGPRRALVQTSVAGPAADLLGEVASQTERGNSAVARCLWRSAQFLSPDLSSLDPGSLAAPAVFLREVLVPAPARWPSGGARSVTDGEVHRIQGEAEITPPRKLSAPLPRYPEADRLARRQGVVSLEAIIDEQGQVTRSKVLKGLSPGLDLATLSAVCGWRFTPAARDGRPVTVYYTLTVNFQLQKQVE